MNNRITPLKNALTVSKNRIILCVAICSLCYLTILIQCVNLQIKQHHYFSSLALKNHKRIHPIIPKRGRIFDRNGQILADNKKAYQISLEKTESPIENTLPLLKKYAPFDIDENTIREKYELAHLGDPILLSSAVSEFNLGELLLHQTELPRLTYEPTTYRFYTHGSATSHIIGNIGDLSPDEYKALSPTERKYLSVSGKNGIEKSLNDSLNGQPGWVANEETAQGKVTESEIIQNEQHGRDIQLTIDINLQKRVAKLMETYSGAAIIVDNQSGEILAAVSTPSYNPNLPAKANKPRLPTQRWPYFNRLSNGLYPPASTVKPFIALEALSLQLIDEKTEIFDPGYYDIPGGNHRYHNWKRSGHGQVDVRKAIAVSCDTFFYKLSARMGSENIYQSLTKFGLGTKTEVELPYEKQGLIPSKSWKKSKGKTWYLGDTINMGIGQGASMVTPLQLAQATLLLANHGTGKKIHFVKRLGENGQWKDIPLRDAQAVHHSLKNWKILDQALIDVIKVGTGHRFGQNKHKAAGKTGTAQVVSLDSQKNDHFSQDHSLFIGYAPYDAPQISVVVILEHNHLASKLASDIIHAYFTQESAS